MIFHRNCVILLVSLLYFFKTTGYKYCSDDIPAAQRPKDPIKWKQWLWVLEGRARSNPALDHFITILIHSFVCLFIYLGFGANDISYLAAFLFMLNPANNQASVWIAGRAYALAALGMTGAMVLPLLSPLFLLMATYYNAGFMSSLVLVGSPHPWLVLLVPVCWLFHWKRFKRNVVDKAKMEMIAEDKTFGIHKFILATKTLGFYIVHGLIPIKTTFYHSFLQSAAGSMKHKSYTMKDRFFWIGAGAILWMGWYIFTHPWGIMSFCLLWYVVCLAPFLNFFRMQQEIAERYMYLPNVGLMVVLAACLQGHLIAMAAVISMYATKLWFYQDSYMDDYFLIEQACLNSPSSWFAWHVRAIKRWDQKSYQEAVILWTMARIISPNEFKILFNIATALKLAKYDKEAEQFMELAMKNVPHGQEKDSDNLYAEWKKGNLAVLL